MSTIEQRARAEYEKCPTPKPSWDQLSDVTKGVWRERVNPPTMRKEVAITLHGAQPCTCGKAMTVTMFDNSQVIVIAPNEAKLREAVQRLSPRFAYTEGHEVFDAVLFDERQVGLDDEI